MQVKMLVEDRDTGYVFLDATNAPADATAVEFTLAPGVMFEDAGDDDQYVWLATNTTIRVVPRDSVDFSGDFKDEWPVPSCVFCLDAAEYEARYAAMYWTP